MLPVSESDLEVLHYKTFGKPLSPSELHVAVLYCAGLRPAGIAELRGTSLKTVKGHVEQIKYKLGATTPAQVGYKFAEYERTHH